MDKTENIRREMVRKINATPGPREALEQKYGSVWNTQELSQEFKVLGFNAPFVVVQRLSDGVKGSLVFQHQPRYYYGFVED